MNRLQQTLQSMFTPGRAPKPKRLVYYRAVNGRAEDAETVYKQRGLWTVSVYGQLHRNSKLCDLGASIAALGYKIEKGWC